MARPVVLSNGTLHVGINNFGLVHDFHYPYVGLENHTLGRGLRHRVGVWVDGTFSWLDDGSWHLDFSYPHTALIGHAIATNEKLSIQLEFDDFVDSELNAFVRTVHVINAIDRDRDIRLFMHQAFVIGDSRGNTDTARFLPDSHALLHYRGDRAFVISGYTADGKRFDQYSTGLFGIEGHEGTWRDAEDGELSMCSVEHGRVDSALRFRIHAEQNSSERVQYWIAAGTSLREALDIHQKVKADTPVKRLDITADWWHAWLQPTLETAARLPEAYQKEFITSAMVLRSHIDDRGAIIASTDSAMLNYGRDAYAYSWPRDGAYVLWPLIRLGYKDEALKFFDFCRRGLHPAGYLAHKYRSDGALGSSWHSYLHDDNVVAPPIQEDETALVVFIFCEYYLMHPSNELLEEYYESFIKPMASFLSSYIDSDTHLPKRSYDLWEERFTTATYTVAVVYAALLSAANMAEQCGDNSSAVTWRSAADDMHDAANKYLFRDTTRFFAKGVRFVDGDVQYDETIDMSSLYGSFMFGLFDTKGAEVRKSVTTAITIFNQIENIGLPRYQNDAYRRESDNAPSNYWPVCSLWLAQYFIEIDQIDKAKRIIDWVNEHAFSTGILAEQVVPGSGYSTSVAPLAWSHAEYMTTLMDLLNDGARDE